MSDNGISPGLTGDVMLAYGVVMWSIGFAVGWIIGSVERRLRGRS